VVRGLIPQHLNGPPVPHKALFVTIVMPPSLEGVALSRRGNWGVNQSRTAVARATNKRFYPLRRPWQQRCNSLPEQTQQDLCHANSDETQGIASVYEIFPHQIGAAHHNEHERLPSTTSAP